MAKRDPGKSASRFLNALHRTSAGLEQQRQRILDRAVNAPRLLPHSKFPVINLTGDPGNDLDYYIYELARLQDMGKSIIRLFGEPQELVDAQAEFAAGIPNLRILRNPLTHPNDNDQLDEVAWFSSAVKLKPDGSVEALVDPRYEQHEVATAYQCALTKYLRTRVQSGIAADPPASIDQQIADRSGGSLSGEVMGSFAPSRRHNHCSVRGARTVAVRRCAARRRGGAVARWRGAPEMISPPCRRKQLLGES